MDTEKLNTVCRLQQGLIQSYAKRFYDTQSDTDAVFYIFFVVFRLCSYLDQAFVLNCSVNLQLLMFEKLTFVIWESHSACVLA